MLHILLIILKIIGIIIVVILGLLLLLLAVLFGVPVRYRMEGTLDKDLKQSGGMGCVTWLLHLIRIDLVFQEQKFNWRCRIAWKSLGSEEEKEKPYEENQKDESEKTESKKIREKTHGNPEKEKKKETTEKNPEPSGSSEMAEEDKKEKNYSKNDKKSQTNPEKTTTEEVDSTRKNKDSGRFSKIKYTIQGICDKIKHIGEKAGNTAEKAADIKDRIVKELEDPVHQKAFTKVKKEIGKLFRRWKPKELKGLIHFGFEDPYHTGQALAVLSIIYPFIGENLSVDPDFEQRILEGDIKVAGRIAMMPLVCLLWNLVWSKAVRQTYHDIRNFKI